MKMIYFILNNDSIKIGYTSRPNDRLSQLQTSSPNKLEMLLLLSGNRKDEYFLHNLFKDLRLNGEWFCLSDLIKNYIKDNQKYDRRYEFNLITEEFDCTQQIRRIRKQKRLTGTELGIKISCNKQRISRIEKDEIKGKITINTLRKCAMALGCELEYRLVPKVDK